MAVETAWSERLLSLHPDRSARTLYAGRGFQLAQEASTVVGAPLYVISAGLGLVASDRIVPTYGLTTNSRGGDSVRNRIIGRFDGASWWRAVSHSPFATPLVSLFNTDGDLPILIALTHLYAEMFGPSLDELPNDALQRVRIFGLAVSKRLTPRVADQVLPYDERLEAVLPGTKADFAQRALLHFAKVGLLEARNADVSAQSRWVSDALSGCSTPERMLRRRLSDAEVIQLVERHCSTTRAIGRLLRLLRDQEGVACEQARFSRLCRVALERQLA